MQENEQTGTGYLSVAAGTANRAYPLPGAKAEIWISDDDGTPTLFRVLVTNESGLTPPVAIPTPPAADSLTPAMPDGDTPPDIRPPDNPEDEEAAAPPTAVTPYRSVIVRLFRDGYTPIEAPAVPIFAGVRSLQYFDMVPVPASVPYTAPGGNS